MKRKPIKLRVVSGCVALAMATGISSPSPAAPAAKHIKPQASENSAAGDAVNAYAEVKTELGVPGEVEIVRERYADGKVRIERQVTLDADGDYVNHGAWKQYSP